MAMVKIMTEAISMVKLSSLVFRVLNENNDWENENNDWENEKNDWENENNDWENENNDWGKCLGLPHTGYGPAPAFGEALPTKAITTTRTNHDIWLVLSIFQIAMINQTGPYSFIEGTGCRNRMFRIELFTLLLGGREGGGGRKVAVHTFCFPFFLLLVPTGYWLVLTFSLSKQVCIQRIGVILRK